LKLTTDRHEASRGLFATAELYLLYINSKRRLRLYQSTRTPKRTEHFVAYVLVNLKPK